MPATNFLKFCTWSVSLYNPSRSHESDNNPSEQHEEQVPERQSNESENNQSDQHDELFFQRTDAAAAAVSATSNSDVTAQFKTFDAGFTGNFDSTSDIDTEVDMFE